MHWMGVTWFKQQLQEYLGNAIGYYIQIDRHVKSNIYIYIDVMDSKKKQPTMWIQWEYKRIFIYDV